MKQKEKSKFQLLKENRHLKKMIIKKNIQIAELKSDNENLGYELKEESNY
jgi:hypothetical protein